MSRRILYQDHTAALTDEALVLRGFTKFFGRSRRVALTGIKEFAMRDRAEFAQGQFPSWGVSDEGVWYTRDPRRYRRSTAIELVFTNGESVGFTPAHAGRFRDLLLQLGVKER